ncbi:tRNA dihydrouridine(20/20a) synthase DusA [Aestuariibius insulae]|uniref:tRNA dihydrouridine(20/20a) synthase DusA n=1 Tax=Aestuariibius insulae TaxID=2058287 RepID=UPI00345E93C7
MHIDQSARLSVAPMMDWTDRHCRFFHRQISRHVLLYTEMITAPALVRGEAVHLLDHDTSEHPVALQLGGSDPVELAAAARLGERHGYDEINLNCGCPSDRVQSGTFGAVLMKSPQRVADCVIAMREAVDVPVTVKCRIGVDDQDPENALPDFVSAVAGAGVTRMTIHARKAWLKGLSPKENREVPPLDYGLVGRMKRNFPDLHISVNGGVASLEAAEDHLRDGLDGVMIGRAAYHAPYDVLARADQRIFNDPSEVSRQDVINRMRPYISSHLEGGGRLHQITRHMMGLFAGQPGARAWRRHLSERGTDSAAGLDVLDDALGLMQDRRAA